jgi:glycosyltransferase involved in cell wall biosynthesis
VALLCPPGSDDAIITGLQFLVERPGWRHVLGANARKEALNKYTWKHHVDAIIEGLRGVAGGAR